MADDCAADPAVVMPPDDLTADLARRVGAKTGKALAGLGLHTVGDLIRHYPRKYLDRGELTDLRALEPDEHATVLARVAVVQSHVMRGRPGWRVQVTISDGQGELQLVFFTAKSWQRDRLMKELEVDTVGLFSGKVGQYQGRRQLANPMYDVLPDLAGGGELRDQAQALALRPIPIYPATSGITSWQIRATVDVVLAGLPPVPDPLPPQVRAKHGLLSIDRALQAIHQPETIEHAHAARKRLKFDEAFILQTMLLQRRAAAAAITAVARKPTAGGLLAAFDAALPFELTPGQRAVGDQLAADLGRTQPMHRLLQGEVGSGKTLVALRAMLTVVDAGGQAALLAPTEVLAAQHHRSIQAMLGPLAAAVGGLFTAQAGPQTSVALLTGSQKTATRRAQLLQIASGEAGLVIGTHALLESKVQFAELGLVVIDEQHRFGVEQRDALRGKAAVPPHLLVMTATPIPRTVAMTVFGDLETSTLTELPPGRSPVVSHLVPGQQAAWLARTWQRIAEEVRAGHQAFVVCPRIGGDDEDGQLAFYPDLDDQSDDKRPPLAVLDVIEALRVEPALAGLAIQPLHGRLPAEERDATMTAFSRGEIDLVVATTVVEVGVDVPNATVMVVLDADRFGMSQLHQLRGRIGRGSAPGLALLVTQAQPDSPAYARVKAVAETTDGFELARLDLNFRREGDVLGAAQSGFRSSLRLLRVLLDEKLIGQARADAAELLAEDPQLSRHGSLAAALQALAGSGRDEYLERG